MPIDWKSAESFTRLLAAIVAATPDMKLDYRRIASMYGEGATYDSIEGRFRIIKKEAAKLRGEIDNGVRAPAPPRGCPSNASNGITTPGSGSGSRTGKKGAGAATPGNRRVNVQAPPPPPGGPASPGLLASSAVSTPTKKSRQTKNNSMSKKQTPQQSVLNGRVTKTLKSNINTNDKGKRAIKLESFDDDDNDEVQNDHRLGRATTALTPVHTPAFFNVDDDTNGDADVDDEVIPTPKLSISQTKASRRLTILDDEDDEDHDMEDESYGTNDVKPLSWMHRTPRASMVDEDEDGFGGAMTSDAAGLGTASWSHGFVVGGDGGAYFGDEDDY